MIFNKNKYFNIISNISSFVSYKLYSTVSNSASDNSNNSIVKIDIWVNVRYSLGNQGLLLFRGMIVKYIVKFWREHISVLSIHHYILMNVKIKLKDGGYASLYNYLKLTN
jgi:hypothetical protein